jgi:multicomponent Na+:H+ antiporter subunit D
MNNILTVPVLLCIAAAAVTLILGHRPRAQRVVSIGALSVLVVVAGVLVFLTDRFGTQVLWVGAWAPPLGIVLVADRLAALMLLMSAIAALAVLLFSLGMDVSEERRDAPVAIFHPTFLLLAAGVSNAFLAGDLFNLYVGFEIFLFASYVLMTLGGTGPRLQAGATYVVVSLVSSTLFLVALATVYAATGTVNLAQLAVRLADLPADVQLPIQLLLLVVFGIKAAVFPMHAWLPDSYPSAPGPVTAVFAGLLTKVGVYAIIRTQTLLFPGRPLTELLLVFALVTMIVGILGAIAQVGIKRMLSFTLVSHIGYMLFGVALATPAGLSGAIFYAAHHITVQATLFLVAGLIARRGGSSSLDKLGGLARLSPALGIMFFLPAMNLAGIPPLSGFIGKLGLLTAGIDVGTPLAWTLVAGGLLTSLLTLYAMAKVWNRAFWGPPQVNVPVDSDDEGLEGSFMPAPMVLGTTMLLIVGIAMTVAAGPLYDFCARASGALLDGSYVSIVLPGGIR